MTYLRYILINISIEGSNAYPMFVNDPEVSRNRLFCKKRHKSGDDFQNVFDFLYGGTDDDDPWRAGQLVRADIGEVQIKRNEGPTFPTAHMQDLVISSASQLLFVDGRRIMSRFAKKKGDLGRKVLIDLKTRHAASGPSGTTRSRVSSAAYRTAALMPSRVSVG